MSALETGISVNPFELERHPMLITLTAEEAKNPAYIDAFSKKCLEHMFTQTPLVDVVEQKQYYLVIRGWKAVQLARHHNLQTITVRLLTIAEEDITNTIYLEQMLATHIAPGRELIDFRRNLNKQLIKSNSRLLAGPLARQRVNGMPISTAYRLNGPTGSKRGRRKNNIAAAEVQLPVDSPSSQNSVAPPEHQPNRETYDESESNATFNPPI